MNTTHTNILTPRAIIAALLSVTILLGSATAASGQSPFHPAPSGPGVHLTTFEGGTVGDASTGVPEASSFWISHDGRLLAYIPDAPVFVNAEFTSVFPAGIDAGTPMIVVIPDTAPAPEPEPEPETPPSASTPAPATARYSGSGADIVTLELEQGLTTIELTHSGSSNFIVWFRGAQDRLLANEIGPSSGTYAIPSGGGAFLLDIEAGGAWTATVRQPRGDTPRQGSREYCAADERWETEDVYASLAMNVAAEIPGAGPDLLSAGAERLRAAGPAGRAVTLELANWYTELGIATNPDIDEATRLFDELRDLVDTLNEDHVEQGMVTFRCITSAVTAPVELDGLHVAALRHNGSSNFIVWLIDDATGGRLELVVNRIGAVDATTSFRVPAGRYRFAVEAADGEWTIMLPLDPR